ncbi:MAG: hypothetical protein ACP5NI_06265 [Acetobacteraceae bacterium]
MNISGSLGPALARHAGERMRHFFVFLFAVDAACRLVAAATNRAIAPLSMLKEAASVQVDVGMRSTLPDYDKFDETDANVVNLQATAFTAIDAAHFCNLGLQAGSWAGLVFAAETMKGDHAIELIEMAELLTGDTCQLPQRVNIGPDRIIDQVHWALAKEFLGDGQPVFSAARLTRYASEAAAQLGLYMNGRAQGKAGLIACCNWYLAAYGLQALEQCYTIVRGNIGSECEARGLSASVFMT